MKYPKLKVRRIHKAAELITHIPSQIETDERVNWNLLANHQNFGDSPHD